ncbi:hypothetical protein [Salipiger marinus]|uniref:Uncharacterized protein n=1 Tax=Salipiger marinus TaxID=555512 RepID=A0A1G8RY22_9RHOB|nr:hypothetical protein [Salipiger marinus]SDJ21866.1 hypothetical protein SAMN04487993_102235 [Salipiger marinus]
MTDCHMDFVTCATALALKRGGMTLCTRLILDLDTVMGGAEPVPSEDALLSVWQAGRRIIEARRQADDVAFDAAHHLLRLALSAYWNRRARAVPLLEHALQVIDPGDRA